MMRENIEKDHQKIANLAIWGPILEPVAWLIPAVARFFCDLFFGTSGGTPLDQFWPPLGHPWSDLVDSLQDFRSKIGPKFKDSKKQIAPTKPSKKQARIPKQLYR